MSDETQHSNPPLEPVDATVTRSGGTDPPAPGDPESTVAQSSGSVTIGATAARPALPGFDLVKELGRGAMGVVYQARQTGLNRLVALKMLIAGEYADPGTRARFLVEAEAVAALEHAHVVRVYAFGEHAGVPYLAMEFLSGGTLADALRRGGPFAPRDAAAAVAKLAAAVAHAHSRGVVHRDIKPGNVLVAADGEPRLADFGLAKVGGSELTGTGAVLGTPAYMAPEQAAGKKEVGPAADVYALGAVLYDLLTGKPPFRGDSVMETLQMVLTADPGRPAALNPAVPRDLETVCLKCLAKAPEARYASAQALADDLNRFLTGEPILARRAGAVERASRWAKRNTSAIVVALLVGGLAVALVVVAARPAKVAPAPETVSVPTPVPDPAPAGDDLIAAVGELDRADPGWRLEQLDKARRAVPAAENSALVIDKAAGALAPDFTPKLNEFVAANAKLAPTAPLPAALRIEKLAPAAFKARVAARLLADRPFGRFPLDWNRDGLNTLLPHAERPRQVAALLQWNAVSLASGGDCDSALADCRAGVNTGRSLHDEPTAISQLVRVSCGMVSVRTGERVLALGTASEKELIAFAAALRAEDAAAVLLVIARAERAHLHRLYAVAESDSPEPPPGTPPDEVEVFKQLPKGAEARVAHAWVLRHTTKLVAISSRPSHERAGRLRAWEDEIKRAAPPGARDALPAAVKLAAAVNRYSSLVRSGIAATALERYRTANGRWPDALTDLVPAYLPAVPSDPEDGAPLRYRKRADGVVVYGVGPDGKDDGGAVAVPPNPDQQPADFGFRLWNADLRGEP